MRFASAGDNTRPVSSCITGLALPLLCDIFLFLLPGVSSSAEPELGWFRVSMEDSRSLAISCKLTRLHMGMVSTFVDVWRQKMFFEIHSSRDLYH